MQASSTYSYGLLPTSSDPPAGGYEGSNLYAPPPPPVTTMSLAGGSPTPITSSTIVGMANNVYVPTPTSPAGVGIAGAFPQAIPGPGVPTTPNSKRKTPNITRILDPLGIVRGGLTMTTAVTTEAYTMVVKK